MSNIKNELDKITERIADANFLANKGLANEVGVHVFNYPPQDELAVRNYIERINSISSSRYRVIVKDLYNIFIEILEEKRVIDNVPSLEEKRGKEFLLEQLQKIATPESFLGKMEYKPHQHGDVLFLTGIGKVFPFMRSHIMLNIMQESFADIPIVVFYPGTFNGQELTLFDKFHDGNYYRAFNLL